MKKVSAKNLLIMLVIGLSTMACIGDLILIPVADNLYSAYTNVAAVNFILSGPSLISAFVSATAGVIIQKSGSKKAMSVGFGFYAAGGLLMLFFDSLAVAVLARALQGVGMGLVGVSAIVIISEVFTDESMRSTMMGIYSSSMSILGALLSFVSGIMASENWKNAYLLFLTAVPILIMIVIALPGQAKHPAAHADITQQESSQGCDEKMPWAHVIRMNLAYAVFNVIYCVVYYQIAVIMAEKGIQNSSLNGLLSSIGTLGCLVVCLLFGAVFGKAKRFTVTIPYVLLLYFSNATAVICVACVLCGASNGLAMTYYMTYATMIVPESKVAYSSSIYTAVMGISTFLATYLPYVLGALLGTDTISATLPFMAVVLTIGCALTVFWGIREKATC